MPDVLHKTDEEADVGAYQAYLRAQTDSDLLDIVRHLDPERYPARLDAAQREARRRHVLQTEVYTVPERLIRYLYVEILALSAVTAALALLLTPEDAAGPSWPTPEMLPDGLPLSEVFRLFTVAVLRGLVVWSAHFGLYPVLLAAAAYWVISRGRRLRQRRARVEIWRLATVALVVLVGTVLSASLPGSAVPSLFDPSAHAGGLAQRADTLLNPFCGYG